MTDVFEADKQRILGITRPAEVTERVQVDLALRAAQAIEAERQSDLRARQEALAHEAALIGEAERAAVEKLSPLKAAYVEREAAARAAVEAIASLWKIESEIREGLQLADQPLQPIEVLIEPTMRARWRAALRARAGLPTQHTFAPDVKLSTDGQRAGAVAVAAITASIILPGRIETPHDTVNFDV